MRSAKKRPGRAEEVVLAHGFVIYKDVPVIYEDKDGRKFYGDVPIVRRNDQTGKFEEVINTRGNGYAGRHRKKYRNKGGRTPRYDRQ